MSETQPSNALGTRLRELRQTWPDVPVTQRHMSEALGLSAALVSSWENGVALPPEARLNAYARFFATRRSMAATPAAMVPAEDLTAEEEQHRSELIDELMQLRDQASGGSPVRRTESGALGGRFWYFPDSQPITILCTALSRRQLGYTSEAAQGGDLPLVAQYATNPTHPNVIRNLGNGDIDALLELVGHIRAENPTCEVNWLSYDRILSDDQLTGHVVVLGGGDADIGEMPTGDTTVVEAFRQALALPVRPNLPAGGDTEYDGEFVISVDEAGLPTADRDRALSDEVYKPRFLRDETVAGRPRLIARGAPQLEADVALVVRTRNPLNPSAKLTMFSGVFSRGTYGAVRAFTDPRFRSRNEQWVAGALDPDDFWLLLQVSVFANKDTITPDLGRPSNRLRMSS